MERGARSGSDPLAAAALPAAALSDDMRPQLGAYGAPVVKSPHLDALAKTGLLFQYAYTQYACE